jgi:hypothetical protein
MKPKGMGGGVEKRKRILKEHSCQWGKVDWERQERGGGQMRSQQKEAR